MRLSQPRHAPLQQANVHRFCSTHLSKDRGQRRRIKGGEEYTKTTQNINIQIYNPIRLQLGETLLNGKNFMSATHLKKVGTGPCLPLWRCSVDVAFPQAMMHSCTIRDGWSLSSLAQRTFCPGFPKRILNF